jgi:hypothetical protein
MRTENNEKYDAHTMLGFREFVAEMYLSCFIDFEKEAFLRWPDAVFLGIEPLARADGSSDLSPGLGGERNPDHGAVTEARPEACSCLFLCTFFGYFSAELMGGILSIASVSLKLCV